MDDQKPMAKFESGATSTTEKPWYHLIPLSGLRRVAERFAYGAKKHGDHNYKKGAYDTNFLRDRKNHMIEHAVKYAMGDTSTDHLGAILCNAMILAELEYIRSLETPKKSTVPDLGTICVTCTERYGLHTGDRCRIGGGLFVVQPAAPASREDYALAKELEPSRARRSEAFRDK